MEATIGSCRNLIVKRRTLVAASLLCALVVIYYGSWLQFLLWLILHIFVAALGLLHGAGLVLCQGKYYKPRTTPTWTQSNLGKLILQRAESDPRLRRLRQRRDRVAPVASKPSSATPPLSRLLHDAVPPITSLPPSSSPSRVVISRNVDVVFNEIFDLIARDFILSWLAPLSRDPVHLIDLARRLYWHVLGGVSERLDAMDLVRFMSTDLTELLDQHFVDIRLATQGDDYTGKKTPFKPHSHLDNPERELKFLRKVADSVLWILLPEDERNDEVLRGLLREVVAYDVLYPTINSICDPDYINQSLLNWIEYRESVATAQKRTYAYAKNYEEFIKMIDESDDVEQLKQIRYQVMTEIMQATTIKKLKQTDSKSPSSTPDSVMENDASSTGRQTKGEMLKARNLKRYINQCTIAKSVAEKRLRVIGGRDYAKYGVDDGGQDDEASIPGKKVLSFNVVMASNSARAAFLKYLQREEVAPLLLFWEGVTFRMRKPADDVMKEKPVATKGDQSDTVDKDYVSQIHHVGTELYQRHISAIQSVVKLNKTTIRGMHAFLLGDEGPEPFETVKSVIGRALEEKYYPSFLVSDIYYNFVSHIPSDEIDDTDADRAASTTSSDAVDNFVDIGASTFSLVEADSRPALAEHSTYAQKKLSTLSAKLLNKSSALDALKAAQKPSSSGNNSAMAGSSSSASLASMIASASLPSSNSKQHRLIAQLEKEVEVLQAERCQLEAFIERTDTWLEHLGRWRVDVSQNSTIPEGGKMIPYFVLLVRLESQGNDENDEKAAANYSKYSDTHGFVVTRRLSDFHLLHKKLSVIGPHLAEDRSFKLPVAGFLDKDTSERFLEKCMAKLQAYMTTVMTDHILSHSEALYAFCCPTPEFLVSPGTGGGIKGGKSVFYYAGLEGFGGIPGGGGVTSDDHSDKKPFSGIKRAFSSKKTTDDDHVDDPHDFLVQDEGGDGKKVADSFAEPMYKLVAEIFELRGVFRFFRQSLITFVRVSFGKSINKQLRDFIQWLFGDSMSVYYLTLFKDSMWLPDGQLAPALPPRTDDEKHDTRRRCKLKLVKNIPDALNHLFGHQTSQQGVIKIFESFQDARLNKHLFYSVFELVVFEVFPELKNADERS